MEKLSSSYIRSIEGRLRQLESNIHFLEHESKLGKLEKKFDRLDAKIDARNERVQRARKAVKKSRKKPACIVENESVLPDGINDNATADSLEWNWFCDTGVSSEGETFTSGIQSESSQDTHVDAKPPVCFEVNETSSSRIDSSSPSVISTSLSVQLSDMQDFGAIGPSEEPAADCRSMASEDVHLYEPEVILESGSQYCSLAPVIVPQVTLRRSCRACRKINYNYDDEPVAAVRADGSLNDNTLRNKVVNNEQSVSQELEVQRAAESVEEPVKKVARRSKKTFICTMCLRKFSQSCNLKTHMRLHNDERPFECDTCKRRFRKKETLENHQRTHNKEKPFQCGICYKKLTRKGLLVNHMKIHLAARPHRCHLRRCDFAAVNNSNLKAHMRIVHGIHKRIEAKAVLNDPICFRCDESFSTYEDLAEHFLNRHKMYLAAAARQLVSNPVQEKIDTSSDSVEEESNETSAGDYACNICGTSCSRWDEFISHVRTHREAYGDEIKSESLEPGCPNLNVCCWCDKVFIVKEVLFQHVLRVHAWGKVFACKTCGQSFYSIRSYNTHRKTRHRDDNGKDSDYEVHGSDFSE